MGKKRKGLVGRGFSFIANEFKSEAKKEGRKQIRKAFKVGKSKVVKAFEAKPKVQNQRDTMRGIDKDYSDFLKKKGV